MRRHSLEYHEYLASDAWKRFRRRAIESVAERCERCDAWKFPHELHVHHRHYNTLGHESLDDVEVLCVECHQTADDERRSTATRRSWNARVDAWASKVYGGEWRSIVDPDIASEEFRDWLDERGWS